MSVLTVVVYAALAMAVVAVAIAIMDRRHRAGLLLFAALAFTVVGVLGILTIGILFLAAAAVCAWVAARGGGARPRASA